MSEDNTKPRPFKHPEHRLVTRRDFLSQGFIGMSAYAFMPSVLGMILSEHSARAATCAASGSSNGAIPFLVFDCAGGAALSGNWVPLDAGGNLLASGKYTGHGLGTGVPAVTTIFGAPMAGDPAQATQVSKVLEGILSVTTPEARANLRMGGIPHQSQSDTGDNMSSAIGYVAALGLQGTIVRSPLGMSTKRSGANSDVAYGEPALKPMAVRSINSILGTINYQGALGNMPATSLKALAKATLNLTQSQAAKLSGMTLGQEFATLVECGAIKNQELATSGPTAANGTLTPNATVDPRLDPVMQQVYGLTPTSSVSAAASVSAAIVYNCLKGYSGPGAIQIGGCDYHDATQATGDRKDLEIGQQIGRAVQAAHAMGKKLAFQVISDGGIYSDNGTRNWRGDSNSRGHTVFGYYDPTGPKRMLRTQVGAVNANGAADTTTLVGNNPQAMAAACFANYLQLVGQMGQLSKFVQPGMLPSDMTPYLFFG